MGLSTMLVDLLRNRKERLAQGPMRYDLMSDGARPAIGEPPEPPPPPPPPQAAASGQPSAGGVLSNLLRKKAPQLDGYRLYVQEQRTSAPDQPVMTYEQWLAQQTPVGGQ